MTEHLSLKITGGNLTQYMQDLVTCFFTVILYVETLYFSGTNTEFVLHLEPHFKCGIYCFYIIGATYY